MVMDDAMEQHPLSGTSASSVFHTASVLLCKLFFGQFYN